MHTLGHDFIPDLVHAGGLRYDGMSLLLSHAYELGLFEAGRRRPYSGKSVFAAAVTFARAEGIIPAPEPSHALAAVVEEAKRCTEVGEPKVILTALCGHGHFDTAAPDQSTCPARWSTTSCPRSASTRPRTCRRLAPARGDSWTPLRSCAPRPYYGSAA